MDAENIGDVFAKGEVDRIYLNFQTHGQKTDMPREDLLQDSFLKDILIFKR